ncbi:tRNA wybutosine-synthesizing protein, putative [Plasmodium chabaudi chabaudi]|uniref:tRNA(Phe) 7-[(3-amino-3-carboxypropyl)-4-demethylwyosine(37)-N(4)]-methyltransferase n=1 Tax=Plasmodium chabaudi chabaudi TaxID=31271 RepID=A0A4V0K397_PLACU|nr:tRNA wybutosine-synthesizing protein, putative [Plasmodium chabaudi chabaudi]VTZ67366.1 tRNA wybutosine-synthesizing protein, putative [Plasmodium chabaudi chabaudi]|eukprot:XP_016655143.1 conserved Plasmodium protein, unknown function [Plasmodium chabaudi chabaudi]
MHHFIEQKKNVLKIINNDSSLFKYVDIYKNCEHDVYNIYLNIYNAHENGNEHNEMNNNFKHSQCCKEIFYNNNKLAEKKVKEIIEEKEIIEKENDKSIKKSIDLLIYPCIYEINRNENYYTSSCCSGRTIIFCEAGKSKKEKKNEKKNENKKENTSDIHLNTNLDAPHVVNELEGNCKDNQFLSYLKKKYILKNFILSNEDGDEKKNNVDINNYKHFSTSQKAPTHRKNVKLFYCSHSHNNLEIDAKNIKQKLFESWKQEFCHALSQKKYLSNHDENLANPNREEPTHIQNKNCFHSLSDNENIDNYFELKRRKNEIKKAKQNIYIKFEPFIIHVKCIDLCSALRLLKIAQGAGLKQSGILNFNKDVTVAIRGSMRLEHYLGNSFDIDINKIIELIDICNHKMSKNVMQLIHFYKCYKEKIHTANGEFFDISYKFVHDKDRVNGSINNRGGKKNMQSKPIEIGEVESRCFEKVKHTKKINLKKYNVEILEKNEIININSESTILKWSVFPKKDDVHNFFVWGHDMFMDKNKIYIFGGFTKGVRNNKLKIYDTLNKEIVISETELPSLAFHVFLKLDDNYAFIFGGRKNPQTCSNHVWVYNIKKNSWSLAKIRYNSSKHIESDEVPVPRYRHACVVVKRYKKKGNYSSVYIFYTYGGVNNSSLILNDIWKGKITINEINDEAYIVWNKKGNYDIQKNIIPIKNHSMIYNNKKNIIYIIGGNYGKGWEMDKANCNSSSTFDEIEENNNKLILHSIENVNYIYIYNIKTDLFDFIKCEGDDKYNFPLCRFSHTSCLIDTNYFVLIGGLNYHRTLNDIWIFNMKQNKWYYLDKFYFNSMYVRSKVVCENYNIYIIGGGCIVFTFGSFFDLPVHANFKKAIMDIEKCNSFDKNTEIKKNIHKNNDVEENKNASIYAKDIKIKKITNCKKDCDTPCDSDLYIIAKDKTFLKEIKNYLENVNNFDKSRKIVFSQFNINNIKKEGFYIPIKRKMEDMPTNFLDKICVCDNKEIFYMNSKVKNEKKKNLKKKLKELFENFVNNKIKNYLNESDKSLILRACNKYEIIGDILIFHYMHLKPLIDLCIPYLKENEHDQKSIGLLLLQRKREKWKNSKTKKGERKKKYVDIYTMMRMKYKYNHLIKLVYHFFVSIKKIFNYCTHKKGENNLKTNLFGRIRIYKKGLFKCLAAKRNKRKKVVNSFSVCIKEGILCRNKFSKIYKDDNVKIRMFKQGETGREKRKIKSIAIYEKITGKLRKNKIYLMNGHNLKTIHTENNVMYKLDLSKCMFCSGNGTEKERMKNMFLKKKKNIHNNNHYMGDDFRENVVDLFCGAGYFTLPLLKFVGDSKINNYYAFDINRHSLNFLKKSIKLNNIKKTNLYILKENSFQMSKNDNIIKKCHRILLGLLPDSKNAWEKGFNLIDDKVGGTLHIHGVAEECYKDNFFFETLNTYEYERYNKTMEIDNTKETNVLEFLKTDKWHHNEKEKDANNINKYEIINKEIDCKYSGSNISPRLNFAQDVLIEIFKISIEDYKIYKTHWKVSISHVEKVKSYAPRIYHYVVDIECVPQLKYLKKF